LAFGLPNRLNKQCVNRMVANLSKLQEVHINAVGIDVSKGKSMVCFIRPFREIVVSPFEIPHTNYRLTNWMDLPGDVPDEYIRQSLKAFSRQYNKYNKVKTMLTNNLISLLDQTFPCLKELFTSQARQKDGHEKWLDFASRRLSLVLIFDRRPRKTLQAYLVWFVKCFDSKSFHKTFDTTFRHPAPRITLVLSLLSVWVFFLFTAEKNKCQPNPPC